MVDEAGIIRLPPTRLKAMAASFSLTTMDAGVSDRLLFSRYPWAPSSIQNQHNVEIPVACRFTDYQVKVI
jgi:hypothetical protein